jgi:hypothetical protein
LDQKALRIGRRNEARRPREHRGPGLARCIHRARYQEGQLREELAVLLGHVVSDHARADLRHPLAHASALLRGALAGVEGLGRVLRRAVPMVQLSRWGHGDLRKVKAVCPVRFWFVSNFG